MHPHISAVCESLYIAGHEYIEEKCRKIRRVGTHLMLCDLHKQPGCKQDREQRKQSEYDWQHRHKSEPVKSDEDKGYE